MIPHRWREYALFILPVGLIIYPPVGFLASVVYLVFTRTERSSPFAAVSILLGLAFGVSAFRAENVSAALLAVGFGSLLFTLGLLFFLRFAVQEVYPLLLGFLVSISGLSVYAVFEVWVLDRERAQGLAFHPNIFGFEMVLGGFATLAWLGVARTRLERLAGLAVFLLALLGLVLSGSRGSYLAAAIGLVVYSVLWLFFAIHRRRWAMGALAFFVLGGVALAFLGQRQEQNLIVNSGFELGRLGWQFGPGASLAMGETVDGKHAVRIRHNEIGWQRIITSDLVGVREGEPYTLSLFLNIALQPIEGTWIRVEAFDRDGKFLARASEEGWKFGGPVSAGGGFVLPVDPVGTWERFPVPLAPIPTGIAYIRFSIINDSRKPESTGEYGLIDAVQLSRGRLTADYTVGPRPGFRNLFAFLQMWRGDRHRSTLDVRDTAWRYGLQKARDRLMFGYGVGAWPLVTSASDTPPSIQGLTHAHNFYLQLLLDWGVFALAGVFLWFAVISGFLFKNYLSGSRLAAAAIALTVAALTANFFDAYFYQPQLIGGFWIVILLGLLPIPPRATSPGS